MARILFAPFSIVAGLVAGLMARKLTTLIWGLIDDEEAPDPEHRDVPWTKLVVSMAIEGAVFAADRGATDHASRTYFARATGVWPGEEEPEPT